MWSTWGASPWEGKSGAEVGIVNRKVAHRARAGQTFPQKPPDANNILVETSRLYKIVISKHFWLCICGLLVSEKMWINVQDSLNLSLWI